MNEEKKRILEWVKEGKLSTDEALTILEEFEKANINKQEKEKEIVTELSTVVNYEEQDKKEEPVYKKFQSAKDKLFDIVDSVLKKVKELDLTQSVELSHIFHQPDVSFKDIDIDIANGKTEIIPWENNDVRIECEAKVYRTKDETEARKQLLNDTRFEIQNDRLQLIVRQKWMKMDTKIFIPQNDYHKIRVRLFNGSLFAENVKAESIKARSANGKLNLQRVLAEDGEFETANGNITLNGVSFKKLEAETINGAIQGEGHIISGDLQTFNGNVKFELKNRSAESLHAKAVTGSVELIIPEDLPAEGELKSNLGGFNLDLTGIQVIEEKNELAQKQLKFKMIQSSLQKLNIFADSKTGSITVKRSHAES
ncbi:DUF4097 family beta strand repeat-containing protein [Peribacillus tepidiphilus]|uniref:DUF4097 family beta strand repeat-containing protein n=1 Tax=Peribacillus tepidiphilus TaxID=2652445 RepID=UPI0035B51470